MRRALLLVLAFMPSAAWPQGDPMGPEFRVNTYTTIDQYDARVAADSSGNFVVVWTSEKYGDSSRAVMAQRFSASGDPLGSEFRVNTFANTGQYTPDVASDASGNFLVVWTSLFQEGPDEGVFGQRYASSGAPLGLEFHVNSYTTGFQGGPSTGVDSAGNFIVIWGSYNQPGGQASDMYGQRYASTGAPVGPEFRINTYTTGFQGGRSVAFDASGNFVIVWSSFPQDGSMEGVFGQRYASSGGPLGAEFRVNTATTGNQRHPFVASDPAGAFTVVWESEDGFAGGIFGQRYASSGIPLGLEFRVNTYITNHQSYPSVAVDASGNFVVVWSGLFQDGSMDGIFGQRFASTGTPLGPEFRVNTYTTEGQSDPHVAADTMGSFVVVWQSELQDGSESGVFGQRFSQMVPVELMRFGVE
jgi:hypothetical protein